jgi:hypothetical protein
VNSIAGLSVVNKELPYTVLCRTNAYLLENAVTDIEDGLIVKIEIDVKDFIKLLESATELFKGNINKIKHEKIIPYSDFSLLTEDKTDRELVRVANMIKSGRSQRIMTVLSNYKPPTNPMITYTTSHKSKGREFSQVILADDFPSHIQDKKWVGLSTENQNLLYVAATRAIDVLEYNTSVKEVIDHFSPKTASSSTTPLLILQAA